MIYRLIDYIFDDRFLSISYVLLSSMSGGRLPERENKGICQISGLKSGRGRLRNLIIWEVVTY